MPTSGSETIELIKSKAILIASISLEATLIIPSSDISIFAPLVSTISRITFPPAPITSRILSCGIVSVSILGAYSPISSRDASIAWDISFRICSRPDFACTKATCIISSVIPVILISICKDVIPSMVPATLKSISPR